MIAGSIGGVLGQRFDGTAEPVITGFFGLGAVALLITFVTEGGKLFTSDPTPARPESRANA